MSAVPASEPALITWSRGRSKFDAAPVQCAGATFAELVDEIDRDRATAKGLQYVAAQFRTAPADELHKAQFPKYIGKHHRCRHCALPRQWIGGDVDGGLDAKAFAVLVQACQQYEGAIYTTASHKPDAPRCRLIIALDQAAPRAELMAASRALRARIDAALGAEGCATPKWDEACDRPEQPLYLPPVEAEFYRLEGGAAVLGELLADPAAQWPPEPRERPAEAHADGGTVVALERHADALKVAANLARMGIDRGAAMALLQSERKRGRWTRDVPDDELARAFDGAAAKYQSGEWQAPTSADVLDDHEAPPALMDVPLAGFMAMKTLPVAFAVAPILPCGYVTLLGGHGGSGKSQIALAIAAHVAAGRSWAGLPVVQGPAVFVSLEDEGALAKYRLQRIATAYRLPADALECNMRLMDGTDGDAVLMREYSIYGAKGTKETATMRQLRDAVGDARLIVIDNASDAFDANENERRHVRSFVRMLASMARASRAAVLLLAHIDKRTAQHGGPETYSGSTAWHNSARSRLALVQEDKRPLELRHEKFNLGEKHSPITLAWRDGIPMPVSEAEAANEAANVSELVATADMRDALAMMRKLIADGIVIPAADRGQATTWAIVNRADDCPPQFRGSVGKERFKAALLRLERRGEIRRETYRTAHRHPAERWDCAQPDALKVA